MVTISTFEELVQFLFERNDSELEWYFGDDFFDPDYDKEEMVQAVSELLGSFERSSYEKSEKAVFHALNYIVNTVCSHIGYLVVDESVSIEKRIHLIKSMETLFLSFFSTHCYSSLAHKGEVESETLNSICYMWWEVLPRHGVPYEDSMKEIDAAILQTLGNILNTDNIACKESALHGLGHWYVAYPEEVQSIVNLNDSLIPNELKGYATLVLKGMIQ